MSNKIINISLLSDWTEGGILHARILQEKKIQIQINMDHKTDLQLHVQVERN